MIFLFFSGSETPFSASRNLFEASIDSSGTPRSSLEELGDLRSLSLSEEAGVDEDALEPLVQGLVEQDGGDGGVHPSRDGAEHPSFGSLPELAHGLLEEPLHAPLPLRAADAEDEVREDLVPVLRVHHLRVELDAELEAVGGADCGEGRVVAGGHRG